MFKQLIRTTDGRSLDVPAIENNELCVAADTYMRALHRDRVLRKWSLGTDKPGRDHRDHHGWPLQVINVIRNPLPFKMASNTPPDAVFGPIARSDILPFRSRTANVLLPSFTCQRAAVEVR